MIKITNINKTFNKGKNNEIRVINNTSLELPDKGLITFLGASGSGKTTLLNVIGGLDRFDKGTISYDEVAMNKYSMGMVDDYRSENIGYVFQNYNLLHDKSIYENLEIALEIIGITDSTEVKKRIEYTLKAVGLFKYRKKPVYALSGGQMQRVSIARALIKNAKVIIADEPTGNLDSTNSIEIMNILKKISQSTLVLLVTHDNNLADFYSDLIIEIKDGVVVNQRANNKDRRLKTKKDNKIYLKDLELVEDHSSNNITTKIYSDSEIKNLDLKLVMVNGTIYLSSSSKIKIVEESNISLIDDHYKELEIQDISDFSYDTSWYDNSNKRKNKTGFFFRNLKNSLYTFFNSRKRSKFLHITLFLIGIIIGIVNVLYCSYNTIDKDDLVKESNVYVVDDKSNYTTKELEDIYTELALSGGVAEASYPDNRIWYEFDYFINSYDYVTLNISARICDIKLLDGYEYLAGGNSTNTDGIVLGKLVADEILRKINEKNVSYEQLIGLDMENDKVVGISSKNTNCIYENYNEEEIFLYRGKWYNGFSSYGSAKYESGLYDIVKGRDIDFTSTNKEVIVNATIIIDDYNVDGYFDSLPPIEYNDEEYKLVGVYKTKNSDYEMPNFLLSTTNILVDEFMYLRKLSDVSGNIELVSGRLPVNDDEIIVNAYMSNFEENSTYSEYNLKVVGKYLYKNDTDPKTYYFPNRLYYVYGTDNRFNFMKMRCDFSQSDMFDYCFEVIDKDIFFNILDKYNLSSTLIYDYGYNQQLDYLHDSTYIFVALISVLLLIVVIYIYFTMRSKMISDIYDIGVYRSIGLKRRTLICKYLVDIFVNSTFTTLLGYILFSIFFGIIASKLSNYGANVANLLVHPSTYLGVLVLYGFNLFFGIIPILMLLRRTPSEINSKYDI